MRTQLLRLELAPSRMLVVIAVNLCVALEAHRYRIFDLVATTTLCRNDVVRLDLDAAESMTNATTPMTLAEQRRNFVSIEGHIDRPMWHELTAHYGTPTRRITKSSRSQEDSTLQSPHTDDRP